MIYYTDGSCTGNGKAVNEGGFGVVTLNDDGTFADAYAKRNNNTTNNREELRAILRVMLTAGVHHSNEWVHPPVVYSDSAYCVNTFNSWMWGWEKRGWLKSDNKEPENLDLIRAYHTLWNRGYRIDLRKCKGHAGDHWNEQVDKLAVSAKEGCNTITLNFKKG